MTQLLQKYFENNFYIIPIRKNDKRPLFKKWNQYPLSYMETRQYIKEGYNIAVVAKDLWILDYDERPDGTITDNLSFYRDFGTIIQFTPHGYHAFYKATGPFCYGSKLEPDTIRHGDMYALIAPSKIDGKSYWWLDSMKGEILTL
ncbi:MAG TPA: bifunctional DNA primase/polymerase [Methylomirabilota bacterium]|nr:bifunctional DNA primase/polymerase [Methylomirabilota bacterium]